MGKDLNGKELGKGLAQRKDGKYSARFVNRFGVREQLYDSNLAELRRRLKEAKREDLSHSNVKTNFTLDEWYERWMSVYKYGLRENSRLHYAQVYSRFIRPVLGRKPLTGITTLDIKSIINDLDERGYQYETKSKVQIILVDMFSKAMIDDFVLKNPAKPVHIVRDELVEPRVLTVDEQADFFDVCRGTFYDEAFTVHVLTGLRPGELFALNPWTDIDFKKREIHVQHTLVYQKFEGDSGKTFHIGPPKTACSKRTIKYNERVELALKSQLRKKNMIATRRTSSPISGLEDLLFVTKYNTPLNSQIYSDAIRRIVVLINENRSDLEQFETFSGHCFRHTFATRCFEAGIQPKTVQKLLGHATLKMTMDLYTHLLGDKCDEDMQKFDAYTSTIFDQTDETRSQRIEEAPKIVSLPRAAMV